jgi:hypothetical protein
MSRRRAKSACGTMRSTSAKRWLSGISAALMAYALGGCEPPGATEPDASTKIPAIKSATVRHDAGNIGQMVDELESDDSAVRLYAIEGLRRMTGEDLGYVYYEDEPARRPAMARWRQWLSEHPPTTAPGARSGQAARTHGS